MPDRYRALAAAIPGACVFLLDEHLTFLAAGGSQLFEVHGLTEVQMLGRPVMDFVAPENVATVTEMYSAILGGDRRTIRGIRRGGRAYDLVGHPYRSPAGRPMCMVIMTDVTARVDELDALLAMATRDEMTGLYNRRGFMMLASQRIAVADRAGDRVAVGFADMDGLKAINDAHGHAVGDAAIVEISRAIERCCRATDVASRIGGDEFVFLAVGEDAAGAISRRLVAEVAILNRLERAYRLGLSVAFSELGPGDDLPTVLERADRDMYRHKRARRDLAAAR